MRRIHHVPAFSWFLVWHIWSFGTDHRFGRFGETTHSFGPLRVRVER